MAARVSTSSSGYGAELAFQLDTAEEDTFCTGMLRDGCLITGHESVLKLWAPQKQTTPLNTVRLPVAGDVTCICSSNNKHFAVSVGDCVLCYDCREPAHVQHKFQFNTEEINEIDWHQNGNFICACDDSGEVKVIDVRNSKVSQTLSGHHENICSTAKFNALKPWEIVSGGLDCKIIRWDFNKGSPLTVASSQEGSKQSGSYMVNPPMVHSINVDQRTNSLVCGLGSGSVAVYSLRGRRLELSDSSLLHSAAVSHVCTTSLHGRDTSVVISGGNDGNIVISGLHAGGGRHAAKGRATSQSGPGNSSGRGGSSGAVKLKCLCSISHGSKVNWLLADATHNAATSIYVADQTQSVAAYQLKTS